MTNNLLKTAFFTLLFSLFYTALSSVFAQEKYKRGPSGGQGWIRKPTVIQSDGIDQRVEANQPAPVTSQVSIYVEGDTRIIESNGIPDHLIGAFPNSGNPHTVTEQSYRYTIPLNPSPSPSVVPVGRYTFGVALNGVRFDPGAAEFYLGNRESGWQYEALSGAVSLGIDESNAHVQPTGSYHYHGLPDLYLEKLGLNPNQHSPLVGWAADGFPIYAIYGYKDPNNQYSEIIELNSSYQLKSGLRPSGNDQPGGSYDGTFVADYEYVAGSGDLDQCNGRHTVTPEYPNGTYAYFLTNSWPVIPRYFYGQPSKDFQKRSSRSTQSTGSSSRTHPHKDHKHPHHKKQSKPKFR